MSQVSTSKLALYGLIACVSAAATPALAHHSYAMFDQAHPITLTGTVTDFQWTNPHIWIQMTVLDAKTHKEVEWAIELAAPTLMARQGWSRKSLKPGDKLVAVVRPLKSGESGAALVSASVAGKQIGGQQSEKF